MLGALKRGQIALENDETQSDVSLLETVRLTGRGHEVQRAVMRKSWLLKNVSMK